MFEEQTSVPIVGRTSRSKGRVEGAELSALTLQS